LEELLAELRTEQRRIINTVAQICWYMRGSVSWSEAWSLDPLSVAVIEKLIKDNVDRTSKTGLPLI